MASGRVPNTVNTFTVTLLYLSDAVICFYLIIMTLRGG
ncbi:hypothetical protein M2263_003374 [Providencia alcalifaciens]|nr:hypothetical protein [Providencia alcalifaciens]